MYKSLIFGVWSILALLHDVTSQGTGVIPDPEMDTCAGAAGPRPINGVFSPGNTATQTVDVVNDGYCGVEINTPGIWWWVNGTGGVIRASTCEERTEIKVKISVFTGTCDALRCVTGTNSTDFECTDLDYKDTGVWDTIATAIEFPTVLGQHYYLLVQETGQSGTVWMNFANRVYPRNNDCIDAGGPLPRDNTPILATTTNADVSDVPEGYCGSPALYPGVWYQFIGTGGEVTVDACGEFNFDGIYINVYHGGSCGDKKCVSGSYETNVRDAGKCSFGPARVLRPLTRYTFSTKDLDRYYIYVHWARTVFVEVTGDFRLFVDDGLGGRAGSGGASAIKFAPPASLDDGSGNGGGNNGGGNGGNNNGKSEATAVHLGSSSVMVVIGMLSSVLSVFL